MSKPWGGAGAGAWALEAERAEAEERELAASAAAAPTPLAQSFPSLKEAAEAKPKKKKPVPIPLTQFIADPHAGLTHDEILRLPTAPRERGPDELEFSGRRGFSSYGSGGGGGGGMRRGGGGFDDETRRGPLPPRALDMDLPSRADEVDNWAAGKKQFAPVDRGPRYGSLGGSSRADEVDNWAAGKNPVQSFGSGYRSSYGGGGSSDSDRWARGGGVGGGGGFSSSNGERKRLILDPPKKDGGGAGNESARSQTRASPFGAARPREEVLAEKGLDWRTIDSEIETKKVSSRPTSSHSSRPSSAQSSRPGTPVSQMGEGVRAQTRSKVNPFGDAKPREVLLQAQGKDWRRIDQELEHRGVDRPETDEEKQLKEEINSLKSQEENWKSESAQVSAEDLAALQEKILQRERQLELLICQLDDKVRFGQRAAGGNRRPTSGAGRTGGPLDARPHSRSGVSEESRSSEFMERPRSRGGMADTWGKPMDDRRGFQSGYFSERNLNRPKSGERW